MYRYNTGSLADISTGSTILLNGCHQNSASAVTNIGFDFWFMGERYTQFSVNSNGQMRLGSTAITIFGILQPHGGVSYLVPISGDNNIDNGGNVRYKVLGDPGHKILVVEWNVLRIPSNTCGEQGYFSNLQVLLYESSGRIEFIYGEMQNVTDETNVSIFISASDIPHTVGWVGNISGSYTYNTSYPVGHTQYNAGQMANLHSTSNGSRWVYCFSPKVHIPFYAYSSSYSQLTGGTRVTEIEGTNAKLSPVINVGFDFYFMGKKYSYLKASSSGFLTFNTNTTNAGITNSLEGWINADDRPLIAPLWDNLAGGTSGTTGTASYKVEGSAPYRKFIFEWLNWRWMHDAPNPSISFQAVLYETTNKIEFYYRQESGGTVGGCSASIGMAAFYTQSGHFYSLDGTGTAPAASNYAETNTLNTRPATGQCYSFFNGSSGAYRLNFTNIAATSYTLNWTDDLSNELGWAIYKSTDNSVFTFVERLPSNSISYNATGLTSGVKYYWRVCPVRESISSWYYMGSHENNNTITIGTGASSPTYIPLDGRYNFGWSALIIKKSEINSAGWDNEGYLTSISFYDTWTSSCTYSNQRIYMAHTSDEFFSDGSKPDTLTMTRVFPLNTSATLTWNASSWTTIELSKHFKYNNRNNILIYYENRHGSYQGCYPDFLYSVTSQYMAKSAVGWSFPTGDGTRIYNRPNMKLTFSPLQIGTSTTYKPYPLFFDYGYERDASVYTASEIGITGGGKIFNISWFAMQLRAANDGPVKIYLKHTSDRELTASTWANYISGATLVYDGTTNFMSNPLFQQDKWLSFDMQSNFNYNGTDNLLVLVETNYGGTGGTEDFTCKYISYTSASNRHQHWNSNNSPPPGNGTVDSDRPNIRFNIANKMSGYYAVGAAAFRLITGKNIYFEKKIDRVKKEVDVIEENKILDNLQTNRYQNEKIKRNDNKLESDKLTGDKSIEDISKKEVNNEVNTKKKIIDAIDENYIPMLDGEPYTGPMSVFVQREDLYKYGLGEIDFLINKNIGQETDGVTVYLNITSAVQDLNIRGISASTTFLLFDEDYSASETFPIKINNITGAGASSIVTFRPASGVTPAIEGNNSTAIFDLNGAQYITFEGSNINGGNTKDLTISNTNSNGAGVRLINDASYDTLRNLIVKSNGSNFPGCGINFSTTNGSTGCDFNYVYNCTITGGTSNVCSGVYFSGTEGKTGDYNKIRSCNITNFIKEGITAWWYYNNLTIDSNCVFLTNPSNSNEITGIRLSRASGESFVIRNKVYDLINTYSSTNYIYGIDIALGNAGDIYYIYNNVVNLESNSPNASANIYGINIYNNTGSTANVYYNSIYIGGSSGVNSGWSLAINHSNINNLNLKNNILFNGRTTSAGSASHVCINTVSNSTLTSDYNDLYYTSANGMTGRISGTRYYTLANWQTASGKDLNSIQSNPYYKSVTTPIDLQPQYKSPVWIKGSPVAEVTTDYNGVLRDDTYPSIGAYEGGKYSGTYTADRVDFATLTGENGFFAAVNNGLLKGNVTINIAADLDEDGTNALNQWFEKGTGGYTLTIQPDGTTQRLIRMLNVNTIPMIDFNGADRVTVNGGAGKYLIFRNTNSNNNNTGPVFRVYNNCSNITIQNCIIESNNGSSGNANITLGSGNNNGITIIDNFLGKATGGSTNLPRTCIYSGNSDNGNVTILNNNFYANYGYAITFPLIGDSCVIKGNSFYNNSGVDYYVFLGAIYIWGESGKHRIEDNWIGGQAPQCEGGNWNMATSATFQAIFLQLSSLTSSVSSIQNNVIRNINMTSTDNAGFRGIWINMNGRVNIGTTTGNIIGHISSPNSINISGTGSVEPISCGVNSVVSNNIIANITQSSSNPGNFYGIYSGGIVSANKIYKVGPTSSSANTNTVIGITCQGSRVINNQVTLGEGVTNNNKYVGLYVYDNNYSYYNSVLILGNSNGSSNSYGYYVTSLSGMVAFCYDNIFFNNRTGGTGKHYATGVYKSLLYDHYNADYNLLIAPNSAAIGEWDNTTQKSFSEWKSVTGQERFSMSNISSNVPYNTFFSESSGGNLNINNNSQLCWYVNGKGKQIATVSTDFDGNPRSTSVENGPTDIGSDEFNTATLPQNITVSGIQTGDHSHFDFAGRRLASLLWGVEGTPPENLTLNFYSGENPPNPYTGRFGKVYWLFTPSGGGGWNYSYNITLFYDPVMMGDIVGESNIRLCKSDNNGTNWTQFDDSPNTTAKTVTHSGLTNFSHFTVGDANAPLPVTLESFTSNVIGRDVKLGWVTSMEINNAGFDVEKLKIENNGNEMWTKIGFVNGRNNSGSRNDYSFEDKKQNSGKYKYRLKQIDFNGSFKYFELQNIVEIGLPDKYELSQNYPNPFNPATKIDYQLPFDSRVTLKIYDISGREINTIINSEYNTGGYYTVDFNASFLASGIYFYRFLAEGNGQKFIMTKKMLVIK